MPVLATLFTITTYGTWLRGDARGWVDEGTIFPPNAILESMDSANLKDEPFLFSETEIHPIGHAVGRALIDRLNLEVLAMCVQSWHAHFIVTATHHEPAAIVKCAKDSARWELRTDRRIWATGYDKRFCFDAKTVHARIAYVERHNLRDGLPARPWPFISPA